MLKSNLLIELICNRAKLLLPNQRVYNDNNSFWPCQFLLLSLGNSVSKVFVCSFLFYQVFWALLMKHMTQVKRNNAHLTWQKCWCCCALDLNVAISTSFNIRMGCTGSKHFMLTRILSLDFLKVCQDCDQRIRTHHSIQRNGGPSSKSGHGEWRPGQAAESCHNPPGESALSSPNCCLTNIYIWFSNISC